MQIHVEQGKVTKECEEVESTLDSQVDSAIREIWPLLKWDWTTNQTYVQDGAPKIAKLPYKWLYGRYNHSIHAAYFMVYKPTPISGAPIL